MTISPAVPIKLSIALAIAANACGAIAEIRYDCQAMESGSYGWSYAVAINATGETAGFSDFTDKQDGRWGPTRWDADQKAQVLDGLGESANAYGINDLGVVVGYGYTPDHITHLPIVWTSRSPTTLALRPGDTAGVASDVNHRGVIVGSSSRDKFQDALTHAVMWKGGRVIDLGALGSADDQASRSSRAVAINRRNEVAGHSQTEAPDVTHAVWWDRDRMIHDLGTIPGGRQSWAEAISDRGIVVGASEYTTENDFKHAVAWVSGSIRDLGVLPGHIQSQAMDINQSRTVVGYGSPDANFFESVALIWHDLKSPPEDLGKLVAGGCKASGYSYKLTYANAINRDGVIAAMGQRVDGLGGMHYGAFKLTPRVTDTSAR